MQYFEWDGELCRLWQTEGTWCAECWDDARAAYVPVYATDVLQFGHVLDAATASQWIRQIQSARV